MELRSLTEADCTTLSQAFAAQGWHKPVKQFRTYLEEQAAAGRDVIVAEHPGAIAGYLTIRWTSLYMHFHAQGIPEIVDLNVFMSFQRQGVATALMDEAEQRISAVSDRAGLGVGLTSDYGPAQCLYWKRGYAPDGRGICKNGQPVPFGANIAINDDVVLYLVKTLR